MSPEIKTAPTTEEEQLTDPQLGEEAAVKEPEQTPEEELAAQYSYDEDLEEEKVPPKSESGAEETSRATEPPADEAATEPKTEEGADEPAGDEVLRAQAKEAGFSEEEIASFEATPGTLSKAVTALDREVAAIGRKVLEGRLGELPAGEIPAGKAPAAKAPPKSAPKSGPGGEEPAPEFKPYELDVEALEAKFDPELVDQFVKMNKHYAPALDAANNAVRGLERLEASLRHQQDMEFAGAFEGSVERANAQGFGDLLGKGPRSGLPSEGEQVKNRGKVLGEMDSLEAGYTATGKTVPPENVLFDRALRNLFGEKTEALARKQIADKVDKRGKQTIQRPTRREQKPVSGDEKAAKRADDFYKGKGMGTDAAPGEDEF